MDMTELQTTPSVLRREIGILGATMMGLGSIIGTGIFVSIGVAAGTAGSGVVAAIAVAALVAGMNGLSSAQLAAAHPVSGGTYEYGYRWLHPALGFTAGWMFLCAKSASAATAALGFAGYLLNSMGAVSGDWRIPLALMAVLVVTSLVLAGIRWSNSFNTVVVTITLTSLMVFVAAGLITLVSEPKQQISLMPSSETSDFAGFLEACALMFVAYTGYGRIATLGEEVRDPRRNIPMAIVIAMLASMLIYVSVAWVAVTTVGPDGLHQATQQQAAPLELAARQFTIPGIGTLIAIGAVTSMLGVLLNLILGLSRVALAMGRRRDLPACFASINPRRTTPFVAVMGVGILIAALVLSGNVKTTWSLSAFTVLVYYALTNAAAIRMPASERRYPLFIPWLGLLSCLFLAFWVEQFVWIVGLGIIGAGLMWWQFNRWLISSQRMEN